MSDDPINDGVDLVDLRNYGGLTDAQYIDCLTSELRWVRRVANAFANEAGLDYKHTRYLEICEEARQ